MAVCMHLGRPGDPLGPCAEGDEGGCDHEDCALYRAIEGRPCVYCRGPISYGTLIRLDDAGGESYAHVACHQPHQPRGRLGGRLDD